MHLFINQPQTPVLPKFVVFGFRDKFNQKYQYPFFKKSYGNNREQKTTFPGIQARHLDTYTVILDVQISNESIELRAANYSIVILYR